MQEQDAYHEDDLYVWDESYQVYHNRIDDEHIILFNLMQEPEENPADGEFLNRIKMFRGTTSTMRRSGSWPAVSPAMQILTRKSTKTYSKP